MLQSVKFIKVLTAVTICTLFTAGFTTQETAEADNIAVISEEVKTATKREAISQAEKAKYVKLTQQIKEEQEAKERAEAEAAAKAQAEAEAKAQAEAEAKAKAQAEAEAAAQVEAEAKVQAEAVAPVAGERELLAALIFCEAGNQPYEGQVAVGAVVMNRVRSGAYPNSISSVIYQSGQFGPAMTGWLDSVLYSGGYTQTAYQAAGDALAGVNPIGDCLYFGNGNWGIQIGDHFFH